MSDEKIDRNKKLIADRERGLSYPKLAEIYGISIAQAARLVALYAKKYGKKSG